jgi:hypothetical protein
LLYSGVDVDSVLEIGKVSFSRRDHNLNLVFLCIIGHEEESLESRIGATGYGIEESQDVGFRLAAGIIEGDLNQESIAQTSGKRQRKMSNTLPAEKRTRYTSHPYIAGCLPSSLRCSNHHGKLPLGTASRGSLHERPDTSCSDLHTFEIDILLEAFRQSPR